MIPLVDLKAQYKQIKEEVRIVIDDVLENTAFLNGRYTKELEEGFARLSGAKHAVGVSSGTTALHLVLSALNIGQGDEVITTPHTFIATAEAITQTGAKIRFVDIDEKTFNIDPKKLEKAITDKTKAVIPVHIYGQSCDISAIERIAKENNIKIIYDAAQAHLARFNDHLIGEFGDAVCYSFYPGKNLGAYGDAGMVTTNDEELAQKMKMLANHGRTTKYEHQLPGYNYRIDEIQAAVLNVKLQYLGGWTSLRRDHAKQYDSNLSQMNLLTPYVDERAYHVYHLYVIRTKKRKLLQEALKNEKIASGVHYPVPLHLQPAYQDLGYKLGDFPVTECIANEILSLPMYPELTEEKINRITQVIKSTLKESVKKDLEYV